MLIDIIDQNYTDITNVFVPTGLPIGEVYAYFIVCDSNSYTITLKSASTIKGTTKISEIQSRMAAILNKQERRLWMHLQGSQEQLLSLLKPCADELYCATEYNRKPLKPVRQPKIKVQSYKPEGNTLF